MGQTAPNDITTHSWLTPSKKYVHSLSTLDPLGRYALRNKEVGVMQSKHYVFLQLVSPRTEETQLS